MAKATGKVVDKGTYRNKFTGELVEVFDVVPVSAGYLVGFRNVVEVDGGRYYTTSESMIAWQFNMLYAKES